jgi:serine acetyltransferase
VAKVGSHIDKDIPPFCLVAGNPATVVRTLPIPPDIVAEVGPKRYEEYVEAHRHLLLEP